LSQVERGFSHAMIYSSKIIDLDEEKAAGETNLLLCFRSILNASRSHDHIRQHGAGRS
jgi:hypothetical protein